MHNRLIAVDPTNSATVTLKFSVINGPHAKSDAKLKSMVDGAVTKTEVKPMIVEKLEKVRGMTKIIEGAGDAVAEVNESAIVLDSDLPNYVVYIAESGTQGGLESNEAAY